MARSQKSWVGLDSTRNHIEAALAKAWQFVDTGKKPKSIAIDAKAMLANAPDEDNPGAPGEDNLLTGAVKLLRLLGKPSPELTKGIASYAYQAIMDMAIPNAFGGAADVLKAERESAACPREIDFQLSYLGAVERLGHRVPRLAVVLAEIAKRGA